MRYSAVRSSKTPIDMMGQMKNLSKIRRNLIYAGQTMQDIDVGTLTQIDFEKQRSEVAERGSFAVRMQRSFSQVKALF